MKQMEEILIRKAKREDISILFDFIKDIAEFEKLSDEVISSKELLEKTIFDSDIPIEAVFAMVDGKEVAFAIYYYNFSTFTGKPGLHLEDLFVKSEYRNRGIGKKIMNYCIDVAKEKGCGRMEWTALKWNPACDFYEEQFNAEALDEWVTYRLTL